MTSTKPWKKPAPKKAAKTVLTEKSKAAARAAAKKAGRRYPNLVDNMNAARKQNEAAQKRNASKKRP